MSSHSIWTPLRHPPFRGLWTGGGVYFVGNAMQAMAAAWLMVELTGSSFLAALVQTAVFLPMFVLSLPAGVLADTTDRRRIIVLALLTQAAVGVLLAVLVIGGWAGAAVLLFFTFVAGCCAAVMSPAWNSTVADTISREELPQAIVAISIAYNGARAVGPALAGVVFAQLGGGWGAGGQVRTACSIHSVLPTASAKTQPPPSCANTTPASAGPTARAPL
jgi:MFS family permease